MAKIDALFKKMIVLDASDLHLTSGRTPMFRVDGDMVEVENMPVISDEQMLQVLLEIAPEGNVQEFESDNDTDFAYELEGVARFRCNLFRDHRGAGGVFRVIPSKILTAEQLNLPQACLDMCYLSKGLVVVTGPTGSGKSTTLAAMVDHINKSRSDHIITIEDPIEFVHQHNRCLVNQREVGRHTNGFKRALRAALREDPDIVLVGEMRDLETIEIAIETAETGHLVFGTLHTTTAASTIDRIIDQFPADRQAQIRTMLAGSIKGVVAQTLCKKKPKGRVAALEVMVGTKAISALIREGKTHQLGSAIQTGSKFGMKLLNDALNDLVASGEVDPMEAYIKAVDKDGFKNQLDRLGITLDLSQLGDHGPAAPAAPVQEPAGMSLDMPDPVRQPASAAPAAPMQQPAAKPMAQPAPQAAPQPAPPAPIPQAPAAPQAPQQGGDGYADPFEEFKKTRK